MKNLLFAIALFTILGCSKDEDIKDNSMLVGKWEFISGTCVNLPDTYEFTGTVFIENGDSKAYTKEDDKILVNGSQRFVIVELNQTTLELSHNGICRSGHRRLE